MLSKRVRNRASAHIKALGAGLTVLAYALAFLLVLKGTEPFKDSFAAQLAATPAAGPSVLSFSSINLTAAKQAASKQTGRTAAQAAEPQKTEMAEAMESQASSGGAGAEAQWSEGEKNEALQRLARALAQAFERVRRYPTAAKRIGIEGEALLSVSVNQAGQILGIEKKGELHPYLEAALSEAVSAMQSRWQPVEALPEPVRIEMNAFYKLY